MATHSKTPWKAREYLYSGATITDANGKAVIDLGDDNACNDPDCCGGITYHIEVSDEDLAHIVHCVNNHDALVAALNEALEYFEDREDVVDGDYGIPAPNKEMLLASLLRMHLEAAEEPK